MQGDDRIVRLLEAGLVETPAAPVVLGDRVRRVRPQLVVVAVVMGTSVRELEDTYFRWLKRTDERLLGLFAEPADSIPAKETRRSKETPGEP